jgi:cytochrome c-type biogenesis protein CcmH/NrfF
MEADLICVTCHAPLDESDSPLAQQMKAEIRRQIAAGRTKAQIEDYFVKTAGFGSQVLAVPGSSGFDLLAWLLPFGTIVFGAGAVGVGARAWLDHRGEPDEFAADPLSPDLERLVDDELARYDA